MPDDQARSTTTPATTPEDSHESDVVSQTKLVFQCPGDSVELVAHRFDWGLGLDLGELMTRRLTPLGHRLRHGAWSFCPRFTAYSASVPPSARFFEAARVALGHWLMQARQAIEQIDPISLTIRVTRPEDAAA